VCLINTQDLDEIRQQLRTPDGLKKVFDLKRRLEDLSGLPCLLVHYQQLSRDTLEKPNVKAIVLTAWKKLKDEARAEELRNLVRQTKRPLIGFCGAHHFIYMAYGGTCADIKAGASVDVKGLVQADKSLAASSVKFDKSGHD